MPSSPEAVSGKRRRLLFVVTEDWYFMSHRLPLARAARDAGYEVAVAARFDKHRPLVEAEGFIAIPLAKLKRTGRKPHGELAAILELLSIYRRYKPDIVHHIAMKPVLYGSLASALSGSRSVVNNLNGLGFVFASSSWKARFVRPFILSSLRWALGRQNTITLVQNRDDRAALVDGAGVPEVKIRLVKGSGVAPELYAGERIAQLPPIVLLASRMIWNKGVQDFVDVAQDVRRRGVSARFVLLGAPDPGNPLSVPEEALRRFTQYDGVEWWGQRSDMPEILRSTAIVCLPSTYGEGIPKILIEAAAAGCPIVTYDVPGCRDICDDGVNGILVPKSDKKALGDAITRLLADQATRDDMGRAGCRRVIAEFSESLVLDATLDTYGELSRNFEKT
jgi:glycosyltransferase involved in cell wall biosynthesis